MKRKDQQQQNDPECIAEVSRRRKKFAVGQQNERARDPRQDQEKQDALLRSIRQDLDSVQREQQRLADKLNR